VALVTRKRFWKVILTSDRVSLVRYVSERTHYKHSVRLLCKDTMRPLCEPITDLSFSSIQVHQSMPNCHIRGEFLAVTCAEPLASGEVVHTVKLIHWKTRKLLLSVSDISFNSAGILILPGLSNSTASKAQNTSFPESSPPARCSASDYRIPPLSSTYSLTSPSHRTARCSREQSQSRDTTCRLSRRDSHTSPHTWTVVRYRFLATGKGVGRIICSRMERE
jgi:hypothetical protein